MSQHHYPLRYLPVSSLFPTPSNFNEMDNVTFERLVNEVAQGGVIETLTVVPVEGVSDLYQIVGGEHRWKAAKAAGETDVPCLILEGQRWKDKDLQEFTMARLNQIKGKPNQDKFLKLYDRVAAKYGETAVQDLLGFMDRKVFMDLVRQTKKTLKETFPKELHDKIEEELKYAQTADDLAAIVQKLMDGYGETMDYSFMVFTHGHQDHVYVQMDRRMKRVMDNVMAHCKAEGVGINDILAPAVEWALRKNKIKPPDD